MIKSWTLKNFKSVRDLNKLDFAPLTIFAGANSSGKSTILQSILLTAQTLQNSVSNKSIILNGHISKFGTFEDILSNGAQERSIMIGFEIELLLDPDAEYNAYPRYFFRRAGQIKRIAGEFNFSDYINKETSELFQLQPKLQSTEIKAFLENEMVDEVKIVRSTKSIEDRVKELDLNLNEVSKTDMQTLEFEVKKPREYDKKDSVAHIHNTITGGTNVGAYTSHFLPKILTFAYDQIEQEKEEFINILTNKQESSQGKKIFVKFVNDDIVKILTQIISEIEEDVSKLSQNRSWEIARTQEVIAKLNEGFSYENYKNIGKAIIFGRSYFQKVEEKKYIIKTKISKEFPSDHRMSMNYYNYDYSEYIEYFFKRQIKYLGPLRDEPKPVYPLSGSSDPKDVGFKGENTAAVLEVNKNTLVKYIPPQHLLNTFSDEGIIEDTLMNAVLNWLDYMGIAKSVDPADKGKYGHELKISPSGSRYMHDLTHVGVGVSQVLPILVLSLLADVDSTLIFEQPELHLNPKVQTRLADFYFSMTLLRKQCLVETHSEYLINRLRYQVAINPDNNISDNIIMYFVEKENEWSKYKKVKINRFGVVENWPRGFFDENEEIAAAILRAAMDKKKQEQSNTPI